MELSAEQVRKLSNLFPPKSLLYRQDEAFLNARARALDAYLQVLRHTFDRRNWNHPAVVQFFRIPELTLRPVFASSPGERRRIHTPGPEEFRTLMAKGERLFRALQEDAAFVDDLNEVIRQLSQVVSAKEFHQDDQRRFYDFKREVELFLIKNGLVTDKLRCSFSLQQTDSHSAIQAAPLQPAQQPSACSALSPAEQVQEQRMQLRFQDAILHDLEATVLEQKHLSVALAEEIDSHNRLVSALQSKQDDTAEHLQKSTKRVQKLT